MGLLPPVIAELTATNSEFLAKMAESKAAMDDVAESGGSSFDKLASSGTVMAAALGTALVGVGAAALDLGVKYQASTAQLAASADISVAAATAIGNAFLSTSGKSVYSAQQMMEAYTPVAAELGVLEGHALNASQALAFMSTASDLAEASGADLGDATQDLTNVMVAYHLSLNQANEASNVLFNTSRLTDQSLDTVTQTFTRLHSQLGEVAPSLSQTGGLLVDLTAHGETGRQAISGLNSAMSSLLGSFKNGQTTISPVTTELQTLGVSVFNAQGKFVGLDSIIGQLHDKFQGMTEAQQLAAAATLFGASAADKMLGVIDSGPAALEKYTAEVDKAGSAHDAAAKKSQDFEEQLKRLEVEVEDSGVRLGEFLIPKVELLTHDLLAGVTWIDHHREALLALTPVVVYMGVAMGAAAVSGVEKLGTSLQNNIQTVANFGAKILGLDAPFAATQTEAEATQAAVSGAAETMSSAGASMSASMTAAADQISASMSQLQASIEANTAAISGSLAEIDSSAATAATGFAGEVTDMEAEYAALRADLETPIVVPPPVVPPPVVPSPELPAIGTPGVVSGGEGVVGGSTPSEDEPAPSESGGTPIIGGGSDVITGLMIVGGTVLGTQFLNTLDKNVKKKNPVANAAISEGTDTLTGAGIGAGIGSVVPVIGTGVGAVVGAVGGAAYGARHVIVDNLKDIANFITGHHDAATPSAQPSQETLLLQAINASAAKDASIKAQGTTFAGMVSQLQQIGSQDGTSSSAYLSALAGLKSTADKWYPEFSKDSTSGQVAKTVAQLQSQEATTKTVLNDLTKDQTLKAAEAALHGDLTQLHNEQKNGASEATQKGTQGLINQELSHIGEIDAKTVLLHKEETAISVGKELETAMGTVKTSVDTGSSSMSSKLDAVRSSTDLVHQATQDAYNAVVTTQPKLDAIKASQDLVKAATDTVHSAIESDTNPKLDAVKASVDLNRQKLDDVKITSLPSQRFTATGAVGCLVKS